MTQKVNSKQLKEIYFNPPSSERAFHETSRNKSKLKKSIHSFLDSEKHYEKYSEEEISKFEDLFNKHYYHPNSEANIPISNKQENMNFLDVFDPLVTDKQLEKDVDANFELNTNTFTSYDKAHTNLDTVLIPDADTEELAQNSPLEQDILKQSTANSKTFTEDFNSKKPVSVTMDELLADDETEIVHINEVSKGKKCVLVEDTDIDKEIANSVDEEIDIALDDDLNYLENLVSNGGNGIATTPLTSIGNLFDEIVGNEKNQISNYETNIFNANIQSLFDADPEDDLPAVPQPPIVPEFIATPPIPPMMPTDSNTEGVDDQAIETKIETDDSKQHKDVKEAHGDFNEFIPNKKQKSKKSKFNLIAIMLVILLLILVGVLLYQFRYLLPFNLPFMNRI